MASFLYQHGRQPKIYIDLPSKGKYYDETVVQDAQYTQIPVFGMNTMDELMLKTPDALFSGEATASIIRSCIPYIKDPWKIVSFDLDHLLIAIRIATSGETLEFTTSCPHCATEADYNVNIVDWLDIFRNKNLIYEHTIKGLQVILKPLTYRTATEHAKEIYKIQRDFQTLNLAQQSTESASRLTQLNKMMNSLNLEMTISHVAAISNSEEIEKDSSIIIEFLKNTEADFYKQLAEHVKEMNNNWSLPKLQLQCISAECEKHFEKEMNMDYSSFFVKIS